MKLGSGCRWSSIFRYTHWVGLTAGCESAALAAKSASNWAVRGVLALGEALPVGRCAAVGGGRTGGMGRAGGRRDRRVTA